MRRELIAVILLIGCLLGAPIQAQPPPPAGLDILFVVDQSGSMGGSEDHPLPNDPNELRFYAPLHATRWLGSDRLQVHTTTAYRLAVLHFGDRVQVGLDWQTINPADTAAWEAQKARLEQALAFEELHTRHLGGTNFVLALEQARQMFDRLPADPAGPHLKALILLTDGEPTLPDQTPAEHMRQVQQYVAGQFPSDQFTLCVVAMNDVTSDFWTRMEPYWRTVAGGCAIQVVSNETDVGRAFRDILQRLTGDLSKPFGTEVEDVPLGIPTTLVVPPYLQSIAFTLDKADPEADKISIEVLEGDPIGFGTPQVQVEGEEEPIETITIYDPPPGRWQIAATEGATLTEVDMRQIRANGVLLSPVGVLPPQAPAQVAWQVQTSQGKPLPTYPDPRYALQVQAEVAAGGQTWPLGLAYDAAQNVYTADFTPTQTGQHTVRLSAISHDIDNREITVFPLSEVGSFEVGELSLKLQGPWSETQALFQPRTLTGNLTLAGQPLVSGAGFSAEATFSAGAQSWAVPLALDNTGAVKGEFIPLAAGSHLGSLTLYAAGSGGQRQQVHQETLAPFTVVAPGVALQPARLTQYCAGQVAVQIDDGAGQTLAAPSGYTLAAEASLSDGSRTPLIIADGHTYRGEITPQGSGSQVVEVRLTTRDPAGREWETFQGAVGTVDVARSTGLSLEIVAPAEEARLPARTPRLESLPLTLTLVLQDEAGNPMDPAAILTGEPVRVMVLDKKEESLPVSVALTPAGTGQIQGAVEGLGVGRYTLVAEIVGKPACGYHVLDPGQASRTVRRVESLTVIGLVAGGPLLLLALVGAVVALVRRDRRRKAHPCKGRVVIQDTETGDYVLNITFPTDRHRRNRFVYKGKLLGKAQGHFSRIEFTCANADESEQGIVNVRVLDLEGEEVTDTELRPPRSGRSTGKKVPKHKLMIYKDPLDR